MASDVNTGGGSRTVASLAARFFGWWFGELRACIPPVLRRLVAGRRRRLYLLLRDDVTDLYEESAGKPRVFASLEQDAPDAAARVLLQRLQDKGPWAEILAVIPAERALRRRLQLPLAVAENLRESIGFDIDRLTPFRAEEVVYQARIAGIDRQRGQVACELTVVPRATVDAALKRASLLGIRPDRVAVEPEEAGTASPAETAAAPIYLPVALGGRVDRWLPWRLPAALAGLIAPPGGWRASISISTAAMRCWPPMPPRPRNTARRRMPRPSCASRCRPWPAPGPRRRRSARRCPWWWMCWPS